MPLANAGAARQDMDLIWGATLTALGLHGHAPLRLELPLGRAGAEPDPRPDRAARARAPRACARALLGGDREASAIPTASFVAEHTTDKFWKEDEAEAAVANSKSPGTVKEITARKNTRKPPTPLNTTAFTTDASSRLGITPSRAMRIAEDLYMDGYISYPRTDNTVYPKSLDTQGAGRASWSRSTTSRRPSSCSMGARSSRPGARRRPPTTRRSTRPRRSTRSVSRRARRPTAGSTSWSPAASSPPSRRRWSASPPGPTSSRAQGATSVGPSAGRDLLRPRLGRARPRLRRDLHLRPLGRHRDPQARGGPGARPSRASRWRARRLRRRPASARAS